MAYVIAGGTAVLFGHSDGYRVGRCDAKHVANLLTQASGWDRVNTLLLCACTSGAGPFAQDLKNFVGGFVTVVAPLTTVAAMVPEGNQGFVTPTIGGDWQIDQAVTFMDPRGGGGSNWITLA